jgi:hypothetical protein
VTGNPGFITEDLARYQGVTVESVHGVLLEWLPPDRRIVLHVGPPAADAEEPGLPSKDAPESKEK